MEATLAKWGNSQGILLPKVLCRSLGLELGDKLEIEEADGAVMLRPVTQHHSRAEKKSALEIFGVYEDPYEAPVDWVALGKEFDWGGSEGEEIAW